MSDNKGIIVQGHGQIVAKQVVAGEGSSASIAYQVKRDDDALADVRGRLEHLLRAVEADRGEISNADEIREDAKRVCDEVVADSPDRLTITKILDRICGAVKSATGLTIAAEAFKMAVMQVLG